MNVLTHVFFLSHLLYFSSCRFSHVIVGLTEILLYLIVLKTKMAFHFFQCMEVMVGTCRPSMSCINYLPNVCPATV